MRGFGGPTPARHTPARHVIAQLARPPGKQMSRSLGQLFAAVILVAGCGGGGTDAPTPQSTGGPTPAPSPAPAPAPAPPPDVINGIAVPPEPAASVVNASPAGVDSNSNGIRDEVDRALARSYGSNPSEYGTAVVYARKRQEVFTLGTLTQAQARAAVAYELAAYQCLRARVGASMARSISAEIEFRTFNITTRSAARQQLVESAGVFILPETGAGSC